MNTFKYFTMLFKSKRLKILLDSTIYIADCFLAFIIDLQVFRCNNSSNSCDKHHFYDSFSHSFAHLQFSDHPLDEVVSKLHPLQSGLSGGDGVKDGRIDLVNIFVRV